jgi:hypothetical protein
MADTLTVYVGVQPSRPGGGGPGTVGVMTVDARGLSTGRLEHIEKHSPDGFAWGYEGSGPADLARSLLIDALRSAKWCDLCDGHGRTAWQGDIEYSLGDAPTDATPETCSSCLGGLYSVPRVERRYQMVKQLLVARLPDRFVITADAVLLAADGRTVYIRSEIGEAADDRP